MLYIQDERLDVQVVATKVSLTFYSKEQVAEKSSGAVRVWTDEDEWGVSRIVCTPRVAKLSAGCQPLLQTWSKVGDPILHVEVSHRAASRSSQETL